MPTKSRWSVDIPQCSLPTLLLKSPTEALPDSKPCFIDAARPDTHFFTPASYRLWCQRFALGLQNSEHFKKGDRLLLFSGNDLFFPVVFLGTVMAGGVFTGANPTFVPRELAHQLRDSGATYLLCAEGSLDAGVEAAKLAKLPLDRVFVFNNKLYDGPYAPGTSDQRGCQYWGELVATPEEAVGYVWDSLTGPRECQTLLALNYSSGTTGVPKGVEITHFNYVSNSLQLVHNGALHPDSQARDARSRWLCFLPMYHAMAQTIFIANALKRGIPVYIMSRFDFLQMLECMQRFRITDFIIVPPIVVALVKHPAVRNYDLSAVERISCGAAPLGREVSEQLETLWPKGKINVKQAWGMTEITCSLLGWDPTETSTSNSVGELFANGEAMIMSEEGEREITARGPDACGELWVRAPNVTRGYWRNPKATAETITPDGWLKTGDIAYMDEKNKIFIVDRRKELIKVKGNQVSPAELEALLLEHPAVADAGVIGMPTPDGDEAPRAYIIRQGDDKGQKIKSQDIIDYVKDKVSRYKRLTGGVVFIDVLPKNPSGKILRRYLRDMAKAETDQGSPRL